MRLPSLTAPRLSRLLWLVGATAVAAGPGCSGDCGDVPLEFHFSTIPAAGAVLHFQISSADGVRTLDRNLDGHLTAGVYADRISAPANRSASIAVHATVTDKDGGLVASGDATSSATGDCPGTIRIDMGAGAGDGGGSGDGSGGDGPGASDGGSDGGGAESAGSEDGIDGATDAPVADAPGEGPPASDGPVAPDAGLEPGAEAGPDAAIDPAVDPVVDPVVDPMPAVDAPPGCTGSTWTRETADGVAYVTSYQALALDGAGNVHVAYGDDGLFLGSAALRYATNATGTWVSGEIVTFGALATSTAGEPGIVVGPTGVVTVAHARTGGGELRIWTRSLAGTWTSVAADATEGERYASLAVDTSGTQYASYYSSSTGTTSLKLATKVVGFPWSTTTIDTVGDVGKYSAIAVDPAGHLHVSYYTLATGPLKYATNATGAWVVTPIDSLRDGGHLGSSRALVLDGTDVHICYYDYTAMDLYYASRLGGVWSTQLVDTGGASVDAGSWCAITLDPLRRPAITYVDVTNAEVKLARKIAGVWGKEIVDGIVGSMGGTTSAAVDATGRIHVTYMDTAASSLRHAMRCLN